MKRYSIRFTDYRLIPTVHVYVPGEKTFGPTLVRRGFTKTHALNRALRWTRAHGDPR